MKTRLKTVILSSALPEDIWLINKISDGCDIAGIVLPEGVRFHEFGMFQVFRKTFKRSGLLETLNQSLMYLYRLIFEGRRADGEMKRIFADKSYRHIEDGGIEILRVADVNDPAVRDFILRKEPDLIVASGTSILKPHILDAGKGRIINLHTGLAPQYRGRYGSYWPVYCHEPELVGVTVHFIDSGIDTGGILAQGLVEYNWNDSAKTITYKQHRLGGELMMQCVQNFETLSQKAVRQSDRPGRNFRTMGLRQYLQAKKWIRKNRRGQVINSRRADSAASTVQAQTSGREHRVRLPDRPGRLQPARVETPAAPGD
jgi:methionyl-tRNA formyltransferase